MVESDELERYEFLELLELESEESERSELPELLELESEDLDTGSSSNKAVFDDGPVPFLKRIRNALRLILVIVL